MAFNFEILLESSQSKIGVVDTGVEPRKSITFVWLCKAKDNGFRRWMTIRKIPLTVSRKGPSTPPLTAALQPQSTRGPVSYCATPSQSRTLSLLSSQYLQPKQIYVNANPINLFIYRKTSSQTGILRFAISCTQASKSRPTKYQHMFILLAKISSKLGRRPVSRVAEISLDEEINRLTFTATGLCS